jgi:ankyrin repeat protein
MLGLLCGCAPGIFVAAERGDRSRVAELIARDPSLVDARDERSLTPLHYAASDGHRTVASALLEAGADPNIAALGGATPLFFAAGNGHAGVVEVLLDHGADPEQRTPWNPLRVAAGEGHLEVVRVLLVRGADPEGHNIPPLLAAAAAGHVDVMAMLLAAGAKINRVMLEDFSSALTVAAARGEVAAVEWLLAHGADSSHDDSTGRTALMLAEENGHAGVAEVLRRHAGAKPRGITTDIE